MYILGNAINVILKRTVNIYLDIEQVLILNDGHIVPHVKNFLKTITTHNVYWLTANNGGNNEFELKRLVPLLDNDEINLISLINHCKWDMIRTDAIDFSQPFLWFTHSVDEFEMEDLQRHKCMVNLHIINCTVEPDALKSLAHKLPQPVQPDTTHSPYKYKMK